MSHKVCFISPEYWPLSGGTGAYVYYLSNELLKNGYRIQIVTGSNQTQDIQVNPNLNVSFLKIPKIPIVKSFLLAGNSYRKLQSVREHCQRRHHSSSVAIDTKFCSATQIWKNPCMHSPLDMERRSRSHTRRTLQPPKRQRKIPGEFQLVSAVLRGRHA